MKKDKIPIHEERAPSGALSSHKALTLDSSLYEKYLEESDLSEEQKQEFLETLWSIIVGFVDLGFEVHPVQQATSKSCGQENTKGIFSTQNVIDVLKSSHQHSPDKSVNAADPPKKDHAQRTVESIET